MPLNNKLHRMILSAMFLAISLVLPLLTGQIKEIGNMLCPMHFPVILCGFFCGPWYALIVGAVAPLLRFLLFGMPPLVPIGISMCFELAVYGFVSGFLYVKLPKKKKYTYISLVASMITGRAVWGAVQAVFCGLGKTDFGISVFISGAFLNAIPGIVLQIIFIPVLVAVFEKRKS